MTGGVRPQSTGPLAAWHVISGRYPPAIGGVASYSHAVAAGLAARGCEVHAWTPENAMRRSTASRCTRRRHGGPSRRLRDAHRLLDACPSPRTLLVQWVPHGYRYKSLNLPFVSWVAARARRGDRVEVMVHEPWLGFESPSPRRIRPRWSIG